MTPIGTFYGDAVYKYDAPRQGRLFAGHPGRIELQPGMNFETALRDLDGFERIWVIFLFHENEGGARRRARLYRPRAKTVWVLLQAAVLTAQIRLGLVA